MVTTDADKFHQPVGSAALCLCALALSSCLADDTNTQPRFGYDNGFFISDAEGTAHLRLNAFAQVRYTGSCCGTPKQDFDIALGRMAFSGSVLDPRLSWFVQAETSTLGNSNGVHLLDGWMSYKFAPQLEVSAGRMLVPYSRQFYTHPGELLFAYLSVADYAFNLPRSVGVQAAGRLKRLNYRAAAMNSIRALHGAGQRNPGSGMAGVARIDFDVLRPYGFSESSPAMPSHPQLTFGFAIGSNPVAELSELQNVPAGVRTGNMTLDAGMRWKRLTAQAAGYLREVRSAAGAQLPAAHGFYGQGGFFVVPRTWEVAARYSSVRFAPAGPLADRELHEYTFGINRYFHDHRLKLQADYSALRSRGATGAGDGTRVRIQLQILI